MAEQIKSVNNNNFILSKGQLDIESPSSKIWERFMLIVTIYSGEKWRTLNATSKLLDLINDTQTISDKKKFPSYKYYNKENYIFTDKQTKNFWNILSKNRKQTIVNALNSDMYISDDVSTFEYGKNLNKNPKTLLNVNSNYEKVYERFIDLIADSNSGEDSDIDHSIYLLTFLLAIIIDDDAYVDNQFTYREFDDIWSILNNDQRMIITDRLNAPNYSGDYNHKFF